MWKFPNQLPKQFLFISHTLISKIILNSDVPTLLNYNKRMDLRHHVAMLFWRTCLLQQFSLTSSLRGFIPKTEFPPNIHLHVHEYPCDINVTLESDYIFTDTSPQTLHARGIRICVICQCVLYSIFELKVDTFLKVDQTN